MREVGGVMTKPDILAIASIVEKDEECIRADERQKFAEWCKAKGYSCYDWRMLIEQYEQEKMYDNNSICNTKVCRMDRAEF